MKKEKLHKFCKNYNGIVIRLENRMFSYKEMYKIISKAGGKNTKLLMNELFNLGYLIKTKINSNVFWSFPKNVELFNAEYSIIQSNISLKLKSIRLAKKYQFATMIVHKDEIIRLVNKALKDHLEEYNLIYNKNFNIKNTLNAIFGKIGEE